MNKLVELYLILTGWLLSKGLVNRGIIIKVHRWLDSLLFRA